MVAIYKYQLELTDDVQIIQVRSPHFFLHFDMQGDIPCIWATADSDAGDMNACYQIIGTGHEIPTEGVHVGTALHHAALRLFVWHLYQVWGEAAVQAYKLWIED